MKYLQKAFFLIIIFPVFFSCNAQSKMVLTPDEFEMALAGKDAVQLLDVRTKEEYNSTHIKGSLLANWNDKAEFYRRLSFIDKQKPVYVYCLSGGRSSAAASQMREMGYQKVYELKGGIHAWKAGNKVLEGKNAATQMSMDEMNNAINAAGLVLVDFGATWCPPCRKMEPVLKSLQTNLPGKFSLFKVDAGKDEEVLKAYNVAELPVFILFKNGKQIWRKDGIAEEKELKKLIEEQ